jgi:hypothetical protein
VKKLLARSALVFAAAAFAACEDEPDPCEVMVQHYQECGLDAGVDETQELNCADDPVATCLAGCVTTTECDTLRACAGVDDGECTQAYYDCLASCE